MPSAKGIRAGRAFVELFADDSKLVRGLRRAEKKLKAFGSRVSSMGRSMAGIGLAAAAPFALATKVFAGFDDQMRAVKAVTQATGDQFDTLNEKAKALGATTSYTAQQVAGAMLELGRGGFDPSQIDDAISSILSLARATGTELPEAAQIAAGTLRAFGLKAEDMGRVADVMTAAANNSAQTLTDMAEAMKYAAPVADAYGMSIEETSKAIGALANFSIRGSMAGNTMKNIMLQLADPGIRKRLKALGVATTDAGGELLNVSTVLASLGKSIGNIPKADRLSLMKELFGKRAIAGGIKLTTASFEKLNTAIDNAGGTAKRTADEMDSGIGGSLRRLWSAAEGIAIAIGDAIAPALSDMADRLSKVAGVITQWAKENKDFILVLLKIAGAILGVGVALMVLGPIISGMGAMFGAFSLVITGVGMALGVLASVITFLVSPIGLVIAAVVSLGAGLLYMSGAAGKACDWLGERFGSLKDDAVKSFGGISDALAAGDISLAMKILWLTLKMEFTRGVNFLEKAWLNFRNFFIRIGYDAWSGMQALAEMVWHGMTVGWIETVAVFQRAWVGFSNLFAHTWEWMKSKAKKAWVWIKGLFDDSTEASRGAAYAKIDKEEADAISKIDADSMKTLGKHEEDRAAKRKLAKQQHETNMAAIGKDNLDKHAALDEEYAASMAQNETELAAARAEWNAAIETAKAKRKQQVVDSEIAEAMGMNAHDLVKGGGSGAAPPPPVIGGAGGFLDSAAKKIGAKGSFNVSSLLGMQAGGASDKLTKISEETKDLTAKIERNTRGLKDSGTNSFGK